MNFRKIISVILVIWWMIVVFSFSNQQGKYSGNISKTIATKIIEVIDVQNKLPNKEKEVRIQIVEPIIRKLAHYSIYILGGILILNCIYTFTSVGKRAIICSSIIGILYAISDETHQLFVSERSGNIADVIIDSLGILTGITIYLLVQKIFKIFAKKTNIA